MRVLNWVKNTLLFLVHIGSWTLWALLIRSTRKESGSYDYDFVGVVLLTEIAKFALSLFLHFSRLPLSTYRTEFTVIISRWQTGCYFAVPAILYGLYNALLFLNLTFFDPVSYRVLINLRILCSGLLFQLFFKQRLGPMKWLALFLLTLGCVINQLDASFRITAEPLHLLAIGFQALTSSFGGIYNEWLLKDSQELSLHVKNMYLYFFSVVFYLAFIFATRPALIGPRFTDGYSPTVYFCIFLGACCGFSTSLFLQHLNIILKEFAHSGEMFLTAGLATLLLGQEVSDRMWLSVLLVATSVALYNRNSFTVSSEKEERTASTEALSGA